MASVQVVADIVFNEVLLPEGYFSAAVHNKSGLQYVSIA